MIQVKYVHPARLLNKKQVDILTSKYIPVVELAALREVVERLKDGYTGDFAAYRWALNDLLASLGEPT